MEKGKRLDRINKKATSIWVDSIEWDKFKENTKKTGQSSCHVLDAFIYGFNRSLEKAGGPVLQMLPKIELNLHVHRQVRRYRRVTREFESEAEYEREVERIRLKRIADKEHFEAYKKRQRAKFWASFSKNPFDNRG